MTRADHRKPGRSASRARSYVCVTLLVGLVALTVLGCTRDVGLSPNPTAQEVVAAAVKWIEAEDSMAFGSGVWLFEKGGGSQRNGMFLVDKDTLYVNTRYVDPTGGPGLSRPPSWVRLSPPDIPDQASAEKAFVSGETLRGFLVFYLPLDPLLVLQKAGSDATLSATLDDTAWEVKGKAKNEDLFRPFLGSYGATRLAAIGNQPDVEFTLTLDKKSGRPLSTLITTAAMGSDLYQWQRGIWELTTSDIQTLNEFTSTPTATTSTSGQ